MDYFSKTSVSFIKLVTEIAKKILANEMKIEVRRTRFAIGNTLYPIHFVVFEDPLKLGEYRKDKWQIAINRQLMIPGREKILGNVIRHELAHMMTVIKYGNDIPSHGTQFRTICLEYGWGKEVWEAKSAIEEISFEEDKISKLKEKVQKLLALAQSSNRHEAEVATIKANEILLKYNLERLEVTNEDEEEEEEVYAHIVLRTSRLNSKIEAISSILKHFYVTPIFSKNNGGVFLEIIGNKENVLIADYVATFLDHKLDSIWDELKKENNFISILSAKNSFMRGLAKGYELKQTELLKNIDKENQLVILKQQLQAQVDLVYGNKLRESRSSSVKHDSQAFELGKQKGKNLSIDRALNSKNQNQFLLEY